MSAEPDDLVNLSEQLKIGLTKFATGKGWDADEYRRVRKTLLASPLKPVLPSFVHFCLDLSDFWAFIKGKFSTYQERREFIATEFAPLFQQLESGGPLEQAQMELGELIGRGGFGEVYKFRHPLLDIDFAVKLFSPVYADNTGGSLDRFFREARILFRLTHQNIIKVHDVGVHKKRPFIKMEYFEGRTLNEVLVAAGRVSSAKARRIVTRMAEGLRHAHDDAGVIHRDLKPSNVMIASPGQLKILDFGLGVFVEDDIVSRLTKTGEAVLGGYYAAPELLANPKLLDPRVDVYSAGAIWFTLLTGRAPAGVDIAEALDEEVGLDPRERETLLKCLRPIGKRHGSAAELLQSLGRLAG